MKYTLNTLIHKVEQMESRLDDKDDVIREMQLQMDQMKDAMDQYLLTANSAYKKKKALEGVGDFLEKRFGR